MKQAVEKDKILLKGNALSLTAHFIENGGNHCNTRVAYFGAHLHKDVYEMQKF